MADVQLLFGPMLIGAFLNAMLYGVVLVQAFFYYQTYKKDALWIRYFILYLVIVETMNTCFTISVMYEPLITRYGTPRATIISPMLLIADPVVTVAISTPVQLFIAWRIKIISQSYALPSVISCFATSALVGGIASTVKVAMHPEYTGFLGFQWAIITWLISSAVCDVAITVGLVWSLYRSKTGSAITDDIINRIIRLTVQTGAITAIAATLDLTFFLAFPNTSMNFLVDFPLSKLYTNSLLSTLNARAGWNSIRTQENGHNVLFGTQNHSSVVRPNRQPELSNNRHRMTAGSYQRPTTKGRHDLEFGISVTKVVERLEDPTPRLGFHPRETQ